jgi:DNA-binding CsgD family transcriptional regulator
LLASLERVRTVGRVELAPFTRGEFDEQVEAILGGPVERGLAQKVYERSEGNAFLVEEMLAIVQRGADLDHLPPSLRDVLLARAEQLPAEVQHVVRVAAVAGRRVPERLLATVAGVPEPALFDALREAVERHVLVVEEAGYAFRHALVRQAIYDEVLPGERAALHAAYGEAVEATPSLAGDEASAAAALAYHWDAARDLPRALAAAVQAAGHAIAAYAPADAERHVARALEMWPQVPDAEQRAGMDRLAVAELGVAAAVSAGHEERAIALVDEALAAIDREAEGARAALLLERRAEALRWSGRGTGMEELEAALSLLPGEPPTPELAVVLASLANAHLLIGQMADAEAIAERAIAAARAAGAPREEASALVTSGSALAYRGDPDAGLAALEAGLRVATAAGDHLTALRASSNLSDLLELMGRHEDAIAAASDGLALAERVGLSRYRFGPFLVANLAEPLMRLGRWTEADAVLAAATETQGLNDRTHALYVARGLIAIGRGEDGARHLALVRQVAGNELDIQQRLDAVRLEAEVAHAEGRLEPARAVLAGALADPGARGLPRFAWPLVALALRVEADVATRARDLRTPPSADALAGLEALAAALRRTAPADHGHAALAAAELARARGEDAVEAWAAAVAAWRAAGEPHPLAYALLRLAEAGLAGGDREAAATAVREAAEIAERLGARPLADAAAALIRRARLEPAAAPAAGPAGDEERLGLTEREREVLRLIAEGRTNAQIAAELFISPKTASVHVSNILRKLDVASRGEAAAMAHRLGLV